MRAVKLLVAIAAACAIAACAGGGGTLSGGISGSGVVFGPITGLGSIVVNGITFETASADITLDEQTGQESDLKIGMVVTVRGQINSAAGTGVASSVDFENVLEGPVQTVNSTTGTIVALGQTVNTDASTILDGVTLASLAQNDVVEISGLVDSNREILATRIELKSGVNRFEVRGRISGVDQQSGTFNIEALTVDFSSAQIDGAPPAGLADGLVVRVRSDSGLVGDTLIADRVQVKDDGLAGQQGERIRVEGFVTSVLSATEFVVNGISIRTTPQTDFKDGTATDVAVNVRLEVEGVVDAQGKLVAEEVDFDDLPTASTTSTSTTMRATTSTSSTVTSSSVTSTSTVP